MSEQVSKSFISAVVKSRHGSSIHHPSSLARNIKKKRFPREASDELHINHHYSASRRETEGATEREACD